MSFFPTRVSVSSTEVGLRWQRSAIIQSTRSNECMWSHLWFPFASRIIFHSQRCRHYSAERREITGCTDCCSVARYHMRKHISGLPDIVWNKAFVLFFYHLALCCNPLQLLEKETNVMCDIWYMWMYMRGWMSSSTWQWKMYSGVAFLNLMFQTKATPSGSWGASSLLL